jgi:hypothetical protein
VTPQFGASLTDDSKVIIYNWKMFITQATAEQDMEKDYKV